MFIAGFTRTSYGIGRLWNIGVSSTGFGAVRPANKAFLLQPLADEGQYELKTLEGIGYGFMAGSIPTFGLHRILSNTSSGQPNIQMEVLVDGSLKFELIDDVNMFGQFNPVTNLPLLTPAIMGVTS